MQVHLRNITSGPEHRWLPQSATPSNSLAATAGALLRNRRLARSGTGPLILAHLARLAVRSQLAELLALPRTYCAPSCLTSAARRAGAAPPGHRRALPLSNLASAH